MTVVVLLVVVVVFVLLVVLVVVVLVVDVVVLDVVELDVVLLALAIGLRVLLPVVVTAVLCAQAARHSTQRRDAKSAPAVRILARGEVG